MLDHWPLQVSLSTQKTHELVKSIGQETKLQKKDLVFFAQQVDK